MAIDNAALLDRPLLQDMDADAMDTMRERLGQDHLADRLKRQMQHVAYSIGPEGPRLYWENMKWMPAALYAALRATGTLASARRHANALKVHERDVVIRGLAPEFDGYRMLHLSDLHLDGAPDAGAHRAQQR